MKDKNSLEYEVGDVWVDSGQRYRRIWKKFKQDCFCSTWESDITSTENTEQSGRSWSMKQLNEGEIVRRRLLGHDKDEREVRLGDEVDKMKVVGYQKSCKLSTADRFILYDGNNLDGWDYLYPHNSTRTKQLFPDKKKESKLSGEAESFAKLLVDIYAGIERSEKMYEDSTNNPSQTK